MLFRLIAAVASASFIAQGAIAQLTPDQVVADMNTVASISRQAESVLGTITQSSSDSDVQNAATVARGYITTITEDLTSYTTAMQATPPFTDCTAAQTIITPLERFVGIHESFLTGLTKKHPIFAQFLLAESFVTPLENLEATFDPFAAAMTDLLSNPDCDNTSLVQRLQDDLDNAVGDAISTYEEICIISVDWPTVPPECASL